MAVVDRVSLLLAVLLIGVATLVSGRGWTISSDKPINYPYERPPIPEARYEGPQQPEYVLQQQLFALGTLFDRLNGTHWFQKWGWVNISMTPLQNISIPCNGALNAPIQVIFGVLCQNGAITQIYLANNNLTGTLPSYEDFFSYFDNQNIQYIFDGNKGLTGPLPSGFPYNTSQMSLFHAMLCNFTGEIPPSLFTRSIQNIAVYGNKLTINPLTPSVGNATNLQWLYIGDNLNTGGDLPKEICKCPLTGLDLTGPSGYTGLPECFGHAMRKTLILLNLYSNQFSGDIPQNWCNLTKMQHLYLQLNGGLTGELPNCIGNFHDLISLAVLDTQMTGPFPMWIFGLKQLENLVLGGSNFYGSVPDYFGNLTKLISITLDGGPNFDQGLSWTGKLPMSLFEPPNITLIELQNTQLTGHFPNVSHLPYLCTLYINQNPSLTGSFPVDLLTQVWTTNISSALQQVNRSINIAQTQFAGMLPALTKNQTEKILWLSTASGAFFLQNDNWYGYIHESFAYWMPPESYTNLFLGNDNIYYPVLPQFLPMTGGSTGTQCQLTGVGYTPWNRQGGANVTVSVSLGFSRGYRLAFYYVENSTSSVFALPDAEAWARRVTDSVIELPWGFPTSTPIISTVAYTIVPELKDEDHHSLWCTLFDVDFEINGTKSPVRVTGQTVTVPYYNPHPTVMAVFPDTGRLEGCASVTLFGEHFTNAPLPQITLMSEFSDDVIFIETGVTVYNDTMVLFTVPPRNSSDPVLPYPEYDLGALRLRFYPAGYMKTDQVSRGVVTYTFQTQCVGGVVPCANNHTDPESCPIEPLCACSTRGYCIQSVNDTKNFTCWCDEGFTGAYCQNCSFNRYGDTCAECDCDHGTCNWGKDADGSCNCERDYLGKRCSVSKIALAVAIPVSLVAAGVVVALVAKFKFLRGPRNEEAVNHAEPLVPKKGK